MEQWLLPKGWTTTKLDPSLIEMQGGFACARKNAVPKGLPHLRPFNVSEQGEIDLSTVIYIPDDFVADEATYHLQRGDVLFNNTNSVELVGKSAMAREPMRSAFSNHITRLRVIDKARLDPHWLLVCLRQLWKDGFFAANCNRWIGQAGFNSSKLTEVEIPLPPLDTQHRIVAWLDALFADVAEARKLMEQVEEECKELFPSILFDQTDGASELVPMRELVRLREPDVVVREDEAYDFAGILSFGRGLFKREAKAGADISYKRLNRLKAGEFTYPKLMAWEGALAIVPPDFDGLVVSPEFVVFEVNQDRVLPETLDVYFRLPSVWPTLHSISTGTNARRRRLHPNDFLRFEMPLPSIRIQHRLREAKIAVDEIRHGMRETEKNLTALTSSALTQAFRGEL